MDIIEKVYDFYLNYKGEKGIMGYTERGREIPYIKVKKTDFPVVLVHYGIHAREHITSNLSLLQIKDFIKNGTIGTVYFIPMVNIDGVEIALRNKPLYKANANGVDLNVNFDAKWGSGESNLTTINDENYIGKHPFSESETKALRDFTLKVKPNATISYHAKGEEIYYQFFQEERQRRRDFLLAKSLAVVTGYRLKSTPNSAGGYKDWCIDKLKIPAFTIEVGKDEYSHPLCVKHLLEIYLKNKYVITTLIKGLDKSC